MHPLPVAQLGASERFGVAADAGLMRRGGGATAAVLGGAALGVDAATAGSGSSLMERCAIAPRALGPEPPIAMHPESRNVAPSAGTAVRANRTENRNMSEIRETSQDHPRQTFRID
jgi:hypothetical protein